MKSSLSEMLYQIIVPILGALSLFAVWAAVVDLWQIPRYILPDPVSVINSLMTDWSVLGPALWVTAKTTITALVAASIGGVLIAIVLSQARFIEMFFSPVFIFLQVTPVVAIAPLLIIYAPSSSIAQLSCAFIVTFFPIMANTLQGLKGSSKELVETVRLYTSSRWKMLIILQLPSALPYIFTGIRIGAGLALVGTVVAEFSAGSAGQGAGLAFRLLESQHRLNTTRLFASLILLATLGLAIYLSVYAVSRVTLRHWYATRRTK